MICEEHNLHIVVHDLEYSNENTIVRVNNKDYFGVTDGVVIHLNSYKKHYFLEEKTQYTTDYIKHKYVLHEDIDPSCFNKIYDKSKTNKWRRKNEPKRFISSGDLVKLLFENGYFKPITYNNASVLSTTLPCRKKSCSMGGQSVK